MKGWLKFQKKKNREEINLYYASSLPSVLALKKHSYWDLTISNNSTSKVLIANKLYDLMCSNQT